jgi:putative endonuclease
MTLQSNELGRWGEHIALKYLQDYGHTVIVQNWRFGRAGELDAVTIDPNGVLTAIEVKTGYPSKHVSPVDQLTPIKLHKLRRLMEAFIHLHPHLTVSGYRIDGILIEKRGPKAHIKHYKNLAA